VRTGVDSEHFNSVIMGALLETPKQKIPEVPNSTSATSATPQPETTILTDPSSTIQHPDMMVSRAATSSAQDQERTAPTPTSSSMQQVMEDRRKRLEADKALKDVAEKERLRAIAQARYEAATQESPVSKQSQYAHEQRKRKLEARAERERILKEIENDKTARKEKEAQRRALAKAEAADAGEQVNSKDVALPPQWAANILPQPTQTGQQCSLQVRLFDGVTIRGKFSPQASLGRDIRTWISEQRTDGDTPYTLKQIVTPLPSRTITISEEEESLQSLGLLPSATMVMVPIQGYTGAYSDQGIVGKAVAMGYNAASTGGNMIVGALGTVLGFGRATPNTGESPSERNEHRQPLAAGEGIKFRTMQRRDDSPDHQLYNGNQVTKLSLKW
ncbi:MAG: hypothetical protein Q9200_007551, partial [Gallowayella weberi]